MDAHLKAHQPHEAQPPCFGQYDPSSFRAVAATPQPPPTGSGTPVLAGVVSDLIARAEMGRQKYGTCLRTHNGRDALVDAYQEALDLVMYLKQCIMERG